MRSVMAEGAIFELVSPRLSPGSLRVVSFRGVEAVSKPFRFVVVVTALGLDAAGVERDLLGQRVTLTIGGGAEPRWVHGIVRRVEAESASGAGERQRLRVWLVPALWRLGRTKNSRVFQDLSVRDVVDQLLAEWGIERRWSLSRPPPVRRYCLQYQESDLAFVSRLLAEEGIFYALEHPASGPEELVLADHPAAAPIAGAPALPFRDSSGMVEGDGDVRRFRTTQRLSPGAVLIDEFDYRRPSHDLQASAEARPGEDAADQRAMRIYDHHAEAERVAMDVPNASVVLEQHRRRAHAAAGESRCRRLEIGRWFELHGCPLPEHDGRYALVRVEHEGHHPEALGVVAGDVAEVYKNRFEAVPVAVACRPRPSRRRMQQVMETAIVVGPPGHEIHTDALGRIKVQFPWDRQGKHDDRSSCWIRVAHAWAGAGWGFQFIPRIGMEVLVTFVGGDVDRPMVIGAAYNAEHPPPFPLPKSKTKSGIRTESSKGGGGFNELSFEDRKGFERVTLRAERDLDVSVGHRHTTRVAENQTIQVGGSRFELVSGNRLSSVGGDVTSVATGNETSSVDGDRSLRVAGNHSEAVRGAAQLHVGRDAETHVDGAERRAIGHGLDLQVGGETTVRSRGSYVTVVGTHDAPRSYDVHVEGSLRQWSAAPMDISSEKEIVLSCGKTMVRLASDRLELMSPTIVLHADGASVELGGDAVKLKVKKKLVAQSDDEITLVSKSASMKLSDEAHLGGSKVKLGKTDSASVDRDDPTQTLTHIHLVDQDGNPLANERYRIVMDDGRERAGVLDQDGKATFVLEGSAHIVFPALADVEEA